METSDSSWVFNISVHTIQIRTESTKMAYIYGWPQMAAGRRQGGNTEQKYCSLRFPGRLGAV